MHFEISRQSFISRYAHPNLNLSIRQHFWPLPQDRHPTYLCLEDIHFSILTVEGRFFTELIQLFLTNLLVIDHTKTICSGMGPTYTPLTAKFADSVDLKDGLPNNRACTVKFPVEESYLFVIQHTLNCIIQRHIM